jgi:hypothetical protein
LWTLAQEKDVVVGTEEQTKGLGKFSSLERLACWVEKELSSVESSSNRKKAIACRELQNHHRGIPA